MKIISAYERLKKTKKIKGVIFGPHKIGKTSLLWTLDPKKTLFVDAEAGDLSVLDWPGDSLELRTWDEAVDIACLLGGPNPAFKPHQSYSKEHFDNVKEKIQLDLKKYDIIFIDSITVVARLAFNHIKALPDFTAKSGAIDTRGAYGQLGQDMISWITQLQHIKDKNIWFVSLLNLKLNEFNVVVPEPQIEGAKTGLELPGIVDQVITMAEITTDEKSFRAFVCQRPNPWGYPAGDRSGKLDMIEKPHLGELMQKIIKGKRKNVLDYNYEIGE